MYQEIVTKCGFLLPSPSCFKPALLPVIFASGVVSSKCPIYCPMLPPPRPGALCPMPSVSTRHLSCRVFLLVLCPFPTPVPWDQSLFSLALGQSHPDGLHVVSAAGLRGLESKRPALGSPALLPPLYPWWPWALATAVVLCLTAAEPSRPPIEFALHSMRCPTWASVQCAALLRPGAHHSLSLRAP